MYNTLISPFIPRMRGGPVSVGHPSVGHGFAHLCLSECVIRMFVCTYSTFMQMFECVCLKFLSESQ